MRKAGRLAALEQEEGGVLLHLEYKEEALAAMAEGQAVCEAVSQKAARGGCLTLSDGQKISLDQTVWTPERQRREALYGMSAPSLERWRRSLAWTFWNRRDFMTRAQEGRTR